MCFVNEMTLDTRIVLIKVSNVHINDVSAFSNVFATSDY